MAQICGTHYYHLSGELPADAGLSEEPHRFDHFFEHRSISFCRIRYLMHAYRVSPKLPCIQSEVVFALICTILSLDSPRYRREDPVLTIIYAGKCMTETRCTRGLSHSRLKSWLLYASRGSLCSLARTVGNLFRILCPSFPASCFLFGFAIRIQMP